MTKATDKTKADKARDISISSIASAAGVDKSHVSMILSGKRMPSFPVAKRMAEAMGMTMDELYDQVMT